MTLPPSPEVYAHALGELCDPIVDRFAKAQARLVREGDENAGEKAGRALLACAAYLIGAASSALDCHPDEAVDRLVASMSGGEA